MSTRSRIAYKTNKGGYLSIYCHFDGRTVINELRAHHGSEKAARSIVGGGDVSFISGDRVEHYTLRGESFEDNAPMHSPDLLALLALCHDSAGV